MTSSSTLGTRVAATVGCNDPGQVLACMRAKTHVQVLLAFPNGQQEFAQTPRIAWGPVVDGLDIPDQPRTLYEQGAFNHVPTIIGSTRDEGWIYADRSYPGGLTTAQYEAAVTGEFGASAPAILARYPADAFPSPKLALSQMAGDVEATCEVRRVARLVERTGTPVYQYSFEREVPAVAGDQVIHGIDRNFLFGTNYGPPSPPYVLNAEDLGLFRAIAGTGRALPPRVIRILTTRASSIGRRSSTQAAEAVVRTSTSRSTRLFTRTNGCARRPAISGSRISSGRSLRGRSRQDSEPEGSHSEDTHGPGMR